MRNRSNLCKKTDFEKFDDRTLLTQGREMCDNQVVYNGVKILLMIVGDISLHILYISIARATKFL